MAACSPNEYIEARKEAKKLNTVEISAIIEAITCKVSTEYGEASGTIIDAKKGIIFTSFHLFAPLYDERKIRPTDFTTPKEDTKYKLFLLLYHCKYIETDGALTDKARKVTKSEEINLSLQEEIHDTIQYNGKETSYVIDPDFIKEVILYDPTFYKKLSDVFQFISQNRTVIHIQTDKVIIEYDNEIMYGEIAIDDNLLINCAYYDVVPIQVVSFEDGLPYGDDGKLISIPDTVNISSFPQVPHIGEKVYFAGFPLTQHCYTFSKGIVASISSENGRKEVVIEAPISPGSSGSCVFVQDNRKLYYIGFVSSEVAYITEEILRMREQAKEMGEYAAEAEKQACRMKKHADELFEHANRCNRGGTSITIGGFSVIEFSTKLSETAMQQAKSLHEQIVSLNVQEKTLQNLQEFVTRNLTTGKGKVFYLPNLGSLSDKPLAHELITNGFRPSLAFFVPKKKEPKARQYLYEYIKSNNFTRLTKDDIINYLRDNADLETQAAIFSVVRHKHLNNDKNYICFRPFFLTKDYHIDDMIKDQRKECIHVFPFDDPTIRRLYELAYLVSQNEIRHGCIDHIRGQHISKYKDHWVTEKFYKDHIGKLNQAGSKKKADEVAERRLGNISISTVIPEQELTEIDIEVEELQSFYPIATEQAQSRSQKEQKIVQGLFFSTSRNYTMHVRSSKETIKPREKTQFFYSVVVSKQDQNGTEYIMHHFAGTEKKDDWEKGEISEGSHTEKSFYYKNT